MLPYLKASNEFFVTFVHEEKNFRCSVRCSVPHVSGCHEPGHTVLLLRVLGRVGLNACFFCMKSNVSPNNLAFCLHVVFLILHRGTDSSDIKTAHIALYKLCRLQNLF